VWDDNKGIQNLFDNTSEAHNDFIKVLFESGLIGLALFVSIFAALLYQQIAWGRRHGWSNIVFIASLVAYLVMSGSDNLLHHTPAVWWLWALWGFWLAEQYDTEPLST